MVLLDTRQLGAPNSSVVNGLSNPPQRIGLETPTKPASLSKFELEFNNLLLHLEVIDIYKLGASNSSAVKGLEDPFQFIGDERSK